jgi:hypothetical protein
MNNITFQYPTWYFLLCIALGVLVALILYYKDQRWEEQPTILKWGLGILRALAVTGIAALLLAPLLKSIKTETQAPIVVVAQDVSESVAAEMEDADLASYKSQLSALSNQLGENYELVELSFGEDVRSGIDSAFQDKYSNISDVLQYVQDAYSDQNLGAVVIASDGIYNQGSNPIYTSTQINAPIYTVALGDTLPKRDLVLKRVAYNKIAYLNDRFAIQVDVAAQNSSGQSSNLMVSKIENGNSRILQTLNIPINQTDFFTTREIILDANSAGVQRYRVSLTTVANEASTVNNTRDFFVEVLDARQKIAVVAQAPHPDITALKQTLTNNENYDVEVAYISDLKLNVREFDFVILHQLPGKANTAENLLKTLTDNRIPHLFIVGAQSSLPEFNRAQSLLTIRGDGRNTDQVQAIVQNDFNLFTLPEELRTSLRQFPPLEAPFGEYNAAPIANTLLQQQIGRVATNRPLFLLGEENGNKIGVLAAEGIWKWRLYDYLQHNNHEYFDELIGKSVQYLSLKEDKRRFRVNLDQNVFDENEQVIFGAELYNQSYELINDADVTIGISNTDGQQYDYTFSQTDRAYRLNAGVLPVGNYTFRANTISNGQQLSYEGQFSVQPIQLELYATTADHNLLRLLSEEYGGELIYPDQLSELAARIEAKGNVKPVIYQNAQTKPIIHLKWLFFVLLALLSVEWFLRRYYGSY